MAATGVSEAWFSAGWRAGCGGLSEGEGGMKGGREGGRAGRRARRGAHLRLADSRCVGRHGSAGWLRRCRRLGRLGLLHALAQRHQGEEFLVERAESTDVDVEPGYVDGGHWREVTRERDGRHSASVKTKERIPGDTRHRRQAAFLSACSGAPSWRRFSRDEPASTTVRTLSPPLSSAPCEAGEATTCTLSDADVLGVTRRPSVACSALTLPRSSPQPGPPYPSGQPLGRAAPPKTQTRGSRQPVRFRYSV